MNVYYEKTEIRADARFCFSDTIDLFGWHVRNNDTGRTVAVIQPVTMKVRPPEEPAMTEEPFLRLRPAEAQVLMDDLWRCGVRPTEAAGSAGAMQAVQEHLKDLRQLLKLHC
jgi:hypothetical protein